MKENRVPRRIEIAGQHRRIRQKTQRVGQKNRKLRFQRKIGFPDIKAHNHPLDAVMLPVISGALFPGPQKSRSPFGNLIDGRLIDADGKG